ncbi:MAG TPA: hypothetical protein VGE07_07330 [Herpetosiphonaceae bacterium]
MVVSIAAIILALGAAYIVAQGLKARREAEQLRAETTDPAKLKLINLNGRAALMTGIVMLVLLLVCGGPPLIINYLKTASVNNTPATSVTPEMVGQNIVLEGRISDGVKDNATGLVAYRKYRLGSKTITLDHERTPPLTVSVPGQSIRIEDHADPEAADYTLEAPPWPRGSQGRISTYGLALSDQVMVVGIVRQDSAGPYVDADLIFGGTRRAYLASGYDNPVKGPFIVGVLVGGVTAALTAALLLYGVASGAVRDMRGDRRNS